MKTYLFVAALFVFSVLGAAQEWIALSPNSAFNSIIFVSPSVGWVVGDNGIVMKTTDRGNTWQVQPVPYNYSFTSIAFYKEQFGIITAPGGLILSTTNGGSNWRTNQFNSSWLFKGVSLTDSLIATVVGTRNLSATDSFGVILRTTDGGLTWTQPAQQPPERLYAVRFSDALTGVACGPNGSVFRTTDGGVTWATVYRFAGYNLTSISFANDQLGMICGNASTGTGGLILKTTNGGSSWSRYVLAGSIPGNIVMKDSLTALCVGSYMLHITRDGGVQWRDSLDFAQTYSGLFGRTITVGDSNIIFLGGIPRLIMKFKNPSTWWSTICQSFPSSPNGLTVSCIVCKGGDTLFAGTGSGRFVSTNDGQTWKGTNPMVSYWRKIVFINAAKGIAIVSNSDVAITTDGGATWKMNYIFNKTFYGIGFVNIDRICVVGAGGIIYYSTNGSDFYQQVSGTTADLFGTASLGGQKQIVVGDSGIILRTTNFGANWLRIASGTQYRLNVVWFCDSLNGIAAGVNGVFLRSSDGGVNWTVGQIPNNYTINDLYFRDVNNGYCVGSNGAVYKTTDNGNTWKKISVPAYSHLLGIAFADANTGYIVGEYGTLLKTTNGGLTFVEDHITNLPSNSFLSQNYPNPFNSTTTISYQIPKSGFVSLIVYDALGREVQTLVNEEKAQGKYSVEFKASNLPSGVYFYMLRAGEYVSTKKLILIK